MIPEEILKEASNNLRLRSRTANGIVDTSASKGKEDLLLVKSGEEAKDTALRNFEEAMEYAWDNKDAPLSGPEDVKKIITTIASIISKGIVKEGSLMRTLDSARYNYVPAARLEEEMDDFCRELFERLSRQPQDPVSDAAFTEFCVDIRGHFFSDGCGKTSLVSACWVLFRRNHPLPEYRGGRDAFYSIIKPLEKGSEVLGGGKRPFETFLKFYRGLFEKETH